MSKEISGGVTVGFPGLLTLLFIALKLMGYIDWSWLWVLSPLWISLAVTLGILVVILVFAGVCLLIASLLD